MVLRRLLGAVRGVGEFGRRRRSGSGSGEVWGGCFGVFRELKVEGFRV